MVEHFALFVQQAAAVVPTTPSFAASLNWPAAQLTLAPRHLVVSVSQHVLESAVVHVEAEQYVVAAAVTSVLPAAHVIEEQSALFVQHLSVSLCAITTLLFLKGSWNAAGPQLRSFCEEHEVKAGLASQHVLTSAAVPHVAPWQYVVVLAAICFKAVGHVRVVHRAAVPQHWATVEPTAPYLDVSLYLPTPQDTPDH
jgi:hypothetical protein